MPTVGCAATVLVEINGCWCLLLVALLLFLLELMVAGVRQGRSSAGKSEKGNSCRLLRMVIDGWLATS